MLSKVEEWKLMPGNTAVGTMTSRLPI